MVICSWMIPNVDLTKEFRAHPSVDEYVLFFCSSSSFLLFFFSSLSLFYVLIHTLTDMYLLGRQMETLQERHGKRGDIA